MIVHPSLMLIASLDERELNADVAADVKRAFVHLAPTTVRGHSASDPACNVLQLKVNFAKKYWLSADEGADEAWPHVKDWLAGKRYFVGENIKSFNKSRGKRNDQTVDYRELDVLMAKNAIRFAIEPGVDLPAFDDVAEQLRGFVNEGTLGVEGPVEVCVPSTKSITAQRAAWEAKLAEEAAKAAEEAAKLAEEQAKAAAEQTEQTADAPAGEAAGTDAQAAPAEGEAAQDAPAEQAEQAAEAAVPEAPKHEPMPIDYSVWGIVVDGTEREFDPAKGAWL